ncbi:hypothetical protein C8R44DRAFT_871628 [Mycena epipterygia]|nr:hypothetical protein C8R44DRAFT_871628 [Mycena epipterygia]
MRSTRTVEALLGEPPLFVDSSRAAVFTFPVAVYGPDATSHAATTHANSHSLAHTRLLLTIRVPPAADADLQPSASSSLSFNLSFH